MHRRQALLMLTSTGALSLAGVSDLAAQQNWPTRPVRLIVPFPPGGPTDTFARLIAGKLQEKWGSR